jgi:hypothetical protein
MGKGEDLGPGLLAMIKKQLFLDNSQQLADFIKWPLTHELYVSHLRQKKILSE